MADNVDIANELVDRNLEVMLKAIDKAIDKPVITNECEECGELIPEQRRQAAPWATTCIECQGIREQKAKHRRNR